MKFKIILSLALLFTDAIIAFQAQHLALPDNGAEPHDRFGSAVASSGDWSAISAPNDSSGTENAYGSVYMYQRVAGEWLLRQKLSQPEPRTKQSAFGRVTAMDAGTLIVSCGDGVMVYLLQEGQWRYQTTVITRDFGISSLAIRGGTLAIGLAHEEQSAVSVYSGQGAAWSQEAVLTSQPGAGIENFGRALALDDTSLLVGAPEGTGRVYVFEKVSGSWSRTGVLTQPDCRGFGSSVVIHETRAMIAAPHYEGYQNPDILGRVCFYQHRTSGWEFERAVRPAPSGSPPVESELTSLIALNNEIAIFVSAQDSVFTMTLSGAPESWILRERGENIVADALVPVAAPTTPNSLSAMWMDDFELVLPNPGRPVLRITHAVKTLVAGELWHGSYTYGPGSAPPDNLGWITRYIRQGNTWVAPQIQPTLQPPRSLLQDNQGFGTPLLSENLAVIRVPDRPDLTRVRTMVRVQGLWQWGQFDGTQIQDEPVALHGNRLLTTRIYYQGDARRRVLTLFQNDGADWIKETSFDMEQSYGAATSFNWGLDLNSGLALDGDTLAFSKTTGNGTTNHIRILHHDGTAWREEAQLAVPNQGSFVGALLALEGDTLAIAGKHPSANLLLYRRINLQWTLEATFAANAQPVKNTPEKNNQLLALHGKRVAVSSVMNGRYGVQVYERNGATWKRLPSPVLASSLFPTALSWAGEALLIETDKKPGNDAALWVLQGGTWKARSSLRASVGPEDTILARSATEETVMLLNLTKVIETSNMFGSTYNTSDAPEILFYDLGSISVQDGPDRVISPSLAGGSTIDFGSVMIGETTTRVITLSNDTPLPFTLRSVTFSGSAAADFKLAVPVTTINTGENKSFRLEHVPSREGSREATLLIQGSIRPLSFRLSSLAVTQRVQPQIQMLTTDFLKPEAEALTLNPSITGTHPYGCQWQKNGRVLPGAIYPALHLGSLKSTDAGLYQLIIDNPTGEIKGPEIAVGVYRPVKQDITAKPGQPVVMKAYAWGPGLIWQWYGNESAFSRGNRTDTLRLLNPEAQPTEWGVSVQMRYINAEVARFTVATTEIPATPSIGWMGNWSLGESVEGFQVNSSEGNPEYLATGLPPGVRLNSKTGLLSGAPNRVGIYRIEWRVRARGLTSLPFVATVSVDTYVYSAGLHAGMFSASRYLPQGGFATLIMTTSGAYSLKLQIGARIYRSTGSLGREISQRDRFLAPFPGTTKTVLRIDNSLSLDLFFELGPDTFDQAGTSLVPIKADGIQGSPLPRGLLFTQPLNPTYQENIPVLYQGSGFASIRMTGEGTANLVGTLPDGTGITATGPVVSASYFVDPISDSLLLYFCPSASSNWVMGSVDLNSLRGKFYEDSTVDLIWGYRNQAAAPDFDQIQLKGAGAPYFPPAPGMLLFPALNEPGFKFRMSFSGAGLSEDIASIGQLSRTQKALFALPNTSRTKVDFHIPTGFFTGSFSVRVPLRKTLNFRGMAVPYRNEGHGLFINRGTDGKVRTGKVYQDATSILEP